MSWIDGHWYITQEAILTLQSDCPDSPVVTALTRERPQANSVWRDLLDIVNGNHWRSRAQSNHFMRRFEGQSVRVAYLEGVMHVQHGARAAARNLASALPRARASRATAAPATCPVPGFASPAMSRRLRDGGRPFEAVDLQPLGDALHALQDSFSESHVRRAPYDEPHRPGEIQHILRYVGEERAHHEERDSEWRSPDGRFSTAGRAAIMASRDLIAWTLTEALRARGAVLPARAMTFATVHRQWMRAAPSLLYTPEQLRELERAGAL